MHEEILHYLHQCLAFALMRQTRFREATAHFVKGAIDPRVPLSYFDELRPALFTEPPIDEKDRSTTSGSVEGDSVEVEVWDGVREYMPDETSVDDISKSVLIFSLFSPPSAVVHPRMSAPCSSLVSFPPPIDLPASQLTLFTFFPCLLQLSSLPYHLQQIKYNDVRALTSSRHQLSHELFSLLAPWRNTGFTSRRCNCRRRIIDF